jgi:dTDP-3-amino-2,3,6-trideoxy-4-keto-D-glucose/dTDP-3-amino-3,4,6-trideoxy-alpha-D-glucose/dTDP-2,6-dideoxy-D-kanosamine transaminase
VSQYGWDDRYRISIPGGRNSRMDELQAAVLRARLPRVADWNSRRRLIARAYARALPNCAWRFIGGDGDD